MAAALVFDTHRFVKRLTDAGMDEAVAEALADEQANLLRENFATKAGLAATEAKLMERMAELKAELLKWTYGALIAQAGIIVAAIKLL